MIAIFDSGYGGLTVLKPIIELLPQYDYLYLGDNGRAPYGNHSRENIIAFANQAVEYLFAHGSTLIIFACNTASAVALRKVQEKYLKGKEEKDRKILGVLLPVAEQAALSSKNGRVGVVGTKATINSKAYERGIAKLNPKIKVFSKACPLLVPFIEENWHNKPEAISILKKYLRPLKSCNIDTLILGCTHYPFMEKHFRRLMGRRIKLILSGPETAASLKEYLARHPEIEKKLSKKGIRHYLTSDDPLKFQKFAQSHLKMKIKMPERVELDLSSQ
ncbi:glutamate racemase [Candidatus Peregrinibacteria bacterium]|nr:glutamate racemase [Candidatus Peregrinibacteria bacterium]